MSAVAAFCEHDVMWGAHIIREDEVREVIAASLWLRAGRGDWLQVVSVDEVRTKLNPCAECDPERTP